MNLPRKEVLKEELSHMGVTYLVIIVALLLLALFRGFPEVKTAPEPPAPVGPPGYLQP
jgi:hypothetical protein